MICHLAQRNIWLSLTKHHASLFQVFEDALEEVVEVKENTCIINNNAADKTKSKLKAFKMTIGKGKNKEDREDEPLSLDDGLQEAQEAIDLFFDNKFEESRQIAQRQWAATLFDQINP